MAELKRLDGLTDVARVLMAMCSAKDGQDRCYLTVREIALASKTTERHVQRIIRKMEEGKVLRVLDHPDSKRKNMYQLSSRACFLGQAYSTANSHQEAAGFD